MGEEAAPTVEVPEFEGGVNAEEAVVTELPEYTEAIGTAGEETAPTVKVPEFEGGVNAVEALKNELPEFTGGANAVQALKHELSEFTGGVNAVEAAVNEAPEYKGEEKPLVTLVAQQDKTYQAPAAQPQQPILPATGSEFSTPLVSVGIVGMLLGLLGMAKKKED